MQPRKQYELFINGHWQTTRSGRKRPIINPATEEVLGECPVAGKPEVENAIAAVARSDPTWRHTSPWERSGILHRIAQNLTRRTQEIARLITLEVGKPLEQSRAEVALAVEQFSWFAEQAPRLCGQVFQSRKGGRFVCLHVPVGPVAAITTWNFPVVLMARKIAPALAAGCTIICKPAAVAPGGVVELVRCCVDAGLPDGVLNLLLGSSADIVPVLMQAPQIRKVSLTGSPKQGRKIAAGAAHTLKRVSLELGGHAPVVVYPDADVEKTAKMCVQAKFRNNGQACTAPSRLYAHRKIYRDFVDCFVSETEKLEVGNGLSPTTHVGPLISAQRLREVESLVSDTKKAGAKLLTGGKRPASQKRGYFYQPTVFCDVPDSARIMHVEPFGPIAPIACLAKTENIVEQLNRPAPGLAAYVFTQSRKHQQNCVQMLRAGMIGVNGFAIRAAEAPFGGVGESGYGREGGQQGILDYMEMKTLYYADEHVDVQVLSS